jgi:hypothetical protein
VWYSLGQYALNSGTLYSVTLDGSTGAGSGPSGNAGRSDAIKWELITPSIPPPTITQQPSNQNVCPNSTAMFIVAATGQGTLSYQWQKNQVNITNGGHYSGCTTTTLTVSNASSGDAVNYRCAVTNTYGTTYSNEASLTLKAATAITGQPQSRTVTAGTTVSFSVTATGDGTLTYQWLKGGVNVTNGGRVSGTTSSTLQITNTVPPDSGSYTCLVTGSCGSVPSNAALLTVNPLTQPGDFDHDGDVDQQDFGVLQWCLAIANPSGDPTCAPADLDGDNTINGQDVGLFIGCMSGSKIPASITCTSGQ